MENLQNGSSRIHNKIFSLLWVDGVKDLNRKKIPEDSKSYVFSNTDVSAR